MIPLVLVDDNIRVGQSGENAREELICIEGVCGDSPRHFHNLVQKKFQRGKIE